MQMADGKWQMAVCRVGGKEQSSALQQSKRDGSQMNARCFFLVPFFFTSNKPLSILFFLFDYEFPSCVNVIDPTIFFFLPLSVNQFFFLAHIPRAASPPPNLPYSSK